MYAVLVLYAIAIIVPTDGKSCHTIKIDMCKEALQGRYNTSIDSVQQYHLAQDYLDHFRHLIKLNCLHLTRLFVCTAHLPLCTDAEFSSILPCRSVCLHVYFNCIHLYHHINLPWPQHLNCTKFPTSPSVCIKPSTPSPASSTAPTLTSAFSSTASPSGTLSSTLSSTLSNKTSRSGTDYSNVNFILFLVDFVPKFIFSLSIFATLVVAGVVVPFVMFLFYCRLRFRGKQGKRVTREPPTQNIPLRELLGPLPPIPEQ